MHGCGWDSRTGAASPVDVLAMAKATILLLTLSPWLNHHCVPAPSIR
jgi:hypothetical protein